MLDFSKLSPMCRYRLLSDLYTKANTQLRYFNDNIKDWEADGSINSGAGKEMVAWRDALKELTDQILKEKNAVVDGNGG
jgi:hypothetical protein